jgi:hypothetical protein
LVLYAVPGLLLLLILLLLLLLRAPLRLLPALLQLLHLSQRQQLILHLLLRLRAP